MNVVQLDILSAIAERDKGIETAISHADSVTPNWSGMAYEMFKEWLAGWAPGFKFLIEDFRLSAEIRGLEQPPSNRAYGFISVRAQKEGLIKPNGTAKVKNKLAHRANAGCWIKI